MTKHRRLRDCLLEGGIKDNYFKYNLMGSEESPDRIYKVLGFVAKKNRANFIDVYFKMQDAISGQILHMPLAPRLEDIMVNSEEVQRAQEGQLVRISQKSPPKDVGSIAGVGSDGRIYRYEGDGNVTNAADIP